MSLLRPSVHSRRIYVLTLTVPILLGIPYFVWRTETRGRFHAVAIGVEERMGIARGHGAPEDAEVARQLTELAEHHEVVLEGLTVAHHIESEGAWRTSGEPTLGLAHYTVHATMRTESRGFTASAPFDGVIPIQFMPGSRCV